MGKAIAIDGSVGSRRVGATCRYVLGEDTPPRLRNRQTFGASDRMEGRLEQRKRIVHGHPIHAGRQCKAIIGELWWCKGRGSMAAERLFRTDPQYPALFLPGPMSGSLKERRQVLGLSGVEQCAGEDMHLRSVMRI